LEAVNGEAGAQMALRERPDLVLIDIQLSRMSGIDVTRRLRAEPATELADGRLPYKISRESQADLTARRATPAERQSRRSKW
jgi:CheY-like chemotaxis protein